MGFENEKELENLLIGKKEEIESSSEREERELNDGELWLSTNNDKNYNDKIVPKLGIIFDISNF